MSKSSRPTSSPTTARTIWRRGDPFVMLTACGLALTILLLVGMIGVVAMQGTDVFWPKTLHEYTLTDGTKLLGTVVGHEERPPIGDVPAGERVNIKTANRDVLGADFRWIDLEDIESTTQPANGVVVHRVEWGDFHGYLSEVRTPEGLGAANDAARFAALVAAVDAQEERDGKKDKGLGEEVVFTTASGVEKVITTGEIVDVFQPNAMSTGSKVGHYIGGAWGFLVDAPRESNTEGGVWPALFGTCMMVMIMTIVVTPFGVIAAVYLHEYAKQGPIVRAIRVAVANLAGVPSIVFGLFGLGFFVYVVGGSLDSLFFSDTLPTPTFGTGGILWASLTLALLTLPVVIVATEESLAAVPAANREGALALGATRWETLRRVVLPASGPGIMTGLILAVARGAGEVAPLMLTGAVKLAPQMPIDMEWPMLHFDRKFMHLGYHIYDLGFQSPNVEAAKPMVYATTLLLLVLVVALNVTAIRIRSRMRKRLQGNAF